jgi:murein DD-endopeptidase MepM/ murein hydrolase activator NlpD
MPFFLLFASLILIPPIPGAQQVKDFDLPINAFSSGHRGVDYLSTFNSPVMAAADGVITHAGLIANRWTITVTHNNLRTTYEPVKPIIIFGEFVKQGQIIGYLQQTGSHCFPESCLHFGLKEGKAYLIPSIKNKRNYPRLLPLYS